MSEPASSPTEEIVLRSPALLAAAWEQPVAAIYRRIALTQTIRALCGPTSAAMVLRSLDLDIHPARVLHGTEVWSLLGLRLGGLTLDQLASVLRAKGGQRVTVLRDLSLEELRAELRRANDQGYRYIANFDRYPLFGWGGGHHSPIGAYLDDSDHVLIADVNRSVGPWLVRSTKLHEAMGRSDFSSGISRGLVRVER